MYTGDQLYGHWAKGFREHLCCESFLGNGRWTWEQMLHWCTVFFSYCFFLWYSTMCPGRAVGGIYKPSIHHVNHCRQSHYVFPLPTKQEVLNISIEIVGVELLDLTTLLNLGFSFFFFFLEITGNNLFFLHFFESFLTVTGCGAVDCIQLYCSVQASRM